MKGQSGFWAGLWMLGGWMLGLWMLGGLIYPSASPARTPPTVGTLARQLSLFSNQLILAQSVQSTTAQGEIITLNGRQISAAWEVRQHRLGIADLDLLQDFGIQLLDTDDADAQPLQWFRDPEQVQSIAQPWWDQQRRYLDITDLALTEGWRWQVRDNRLDIVLPASQLLAIRQGGQVWGDRVVIDLSHPTTISVQEEPGHFTITLDSPITPTQLAQFVAEPGRLMTQLHVSTNGRQTLLRGQIDPQARVNLTTLNAPNRVVIDIRPDALVRRNILWAPGIRWQQQYVAVDSSHFPVYSITLDPRHPNVSMRPIWTEPATVPGLTPLTTLASQWQAAIAINGGFFNRNNQLPLGAIRADGQWNSGPILDRGAIAWNATGDIYVNHLALNQSLSTDQDQQFAITAVNSGYVQAGIGMYTPTWAASYTPILDDETLIIVAQDRVIQHQAGGPAGTRTVTIPRDGYVLAIRAYTTAVNALPPGTRLNLNTVTTPVEFDSYPYSMGGGPMLISNRTIVLNPEAEQFSHAFATQSAPRSAIGRTADGHILLVAVHNQPNGRGPTLQQLAEIMVQLGCIDALNLDGGSSSSLYLSGTLLNRDPQTVARVNNGIGIFLSP